MPTNFYGRMLKLSGCLLSCFLLLACGQPLQKFTNIDTVALVDTIISPAQAADAQEPGFSPPPCVLDKLTWADFEPDMTEPQNDVPLWYTIGDQLDFAVDTKQPEIAKYLRQYRTHPHHVASMADRAAPFMHYIVQSVNANDLPVDLALLPMVESAFDPFIVSQSGAAGIWQIMPQTGSGFGLKQDWWFDGRRDIMASTKVALQYLKDLHIMFKGDWMLALAAYNSGPGTVKKAMMKNRRQNKPVDFFSLQLPKETRSYVPKLLALSYAIRHADEFKIKLPPTPNKAFLRTVSLDKQIDLAMAADFAGVDLKTVYHYNPGYMRWATHPDGPHDLLLPIQAAHSLDKKLKSSDSEAWHQWHRYQVKPGDTISAIAMLYRTTATAIKEVNRLGTDKIEIGRHLLIPGGFERANINFAKAFHGKEDFKYPDHSSQVHVVQRGESLWTISKQYGITLQQLAKLNAISSKAILHPGQHLVVELTG